MNQPPACNLFSENGFPLLDCTGFSQYPTGILHNSHRSLLYVDGCQIIVVKGCLLWQLLRLGFFFVSCSQSGREETEAKARYKWCEKC